MLMEAQPIAVDPKINFQSVGGLDQFIGKLKEIVLFPLMYSEFYAETKMSPPRGILLHGPPGELIYDIFFLLILPCQLSPINDRGTIF